jgi:hypothetical protein
MVCEDVRDCVWITVFVAAMTSEFVRPPLTRRDISGRLPGIRLKLSDSRSGNVSRKGIDARSLRASRSEAEVRQPTGVDREGLDA